MELLVWLEATGLATWVRESISLWAYPSILASHAIGLAFLVGGCVALDVRLLGYPGDLPLAPMKKFLPLIWVGFWVNAVSGGLLLIASATTMLTSVVFWIKLIFIALAVGTLVMMKTRVFADEVSLEAGLIPKAGKTLAIASIAFWGGAIVAGRLTAYTMLIASTFGGD